MWRSVRAFVLVGGVLAAGLAAGSATLTSAWARGRNPYVGLDTLARAMTTIENRYVDEVAPEDLIYTAVEGMAEGLDPHTIFLDPDAYQSLRDSTEGRYLGIGVSLLREPGGFRVDEVVPGAPAEAAGVQAGDLLVAVGGVPLDPDNPDQLDKLLDGPRGTPVTITIERDGVQQDIRVVRDQVVQPSVVAELFEPGWAYVRLKHFRMRSAREVRTALDTMAAQGGAPLQGVVLDLRDNPGGLLDEAVEVVDFFATEGVIVETRRRGQVTEDVHRATQDAADLDAAVVVLIDGGSASASELVAGAFRDLGRGTLVGSRSFGKGSVQQVFEFEDGSALKLTVARYHLPSGETIADRQGLTPQVEVRRATPRQAAADEVRGVLADLELPEDTRAALEDDMALLGRPGGERYPAVEDQELPVPWKGSLEERMVLDPQLRAAWATVRAGP